MARFSFARQCLVLLLLLTLLAAIPALGDDHQSRLSQVDKLFDECNRPDAPGCAVGIIRDGKLIYRKGFGAADLGSGALNAPTTLFEIASASKGFTSACIALLMDQGKIHPDDDVRKFIPELAKHDEPIRIRHMLRCESGTWEQFHIMPLVGLENVPVPASYSKADLLTLLAGQKRLSFKPGSEFQYASGEFFLLGIVVERVTGKTLAQFAKENIFGPAGMTRTYFEEDPGLVVKDRAVGHWKSTDGWSSLGRDPGGEWRQWKANSSVAGGGGVNTSIDDLYRFDLAMDGGTLPRGQYMDEFLKEGSVLGNRFCLDADAYIKKVQEHPENPPPGQYRGLRRIQFTGGFWGFTACISRFPEQRFTVICLSNNSDFSAFAKTRAIAELFLGDQMQPVPKSESDAAPAYVQLSPATLKKRTGAFRHTDKSPVWQTAVKDGDLVLIDHLDKSFVLKPVNPTRFVPTGKTPFYRSARFDFELDDSGRARRMVLSSCENQIHDVIPFSPVELAPPLSDGDLRDYVGEYVSEELATTYRFKLEQGALWLRVNFRHWERLRPLVKDEFTPDARDPHDQRFVRFSRDEQGNVNGFDVSFWRIRGVRFEKRS